MKKALMAILWAVYEAVFGGSLFFCLVGGVGMFDTDAAARRYLLKSGILSVLLPTAVFWLSVTVSRQAEEIEELTIKNHLLELILRNFKGGHPRESVEETQRGWMPVLVCAFCSSNGLKEKEKEELLQYIAEI